ncbi:RidA family protein [Pokkaliibacter plantistimulans]|uniref:RidA family protein n=1 Tax=Proteobacteria bacterium 228 TaxID=2083153 RepID=A0A2S5KWR8_9PROT|nr:RidA family protein [Pokkaliibacter plantistimulans]PPC79304.1 RidA family protein [Pokkaliibacter plantistimulans]
MSVPTKLPFSKIRIENGFAMLAGELPFLPDGAVPESVTEQVDVMLGRVRDTLQAHGLSMQDVVSCTVYLTDRSDFAEFNQAYAPWFSEPLPVRTTVCAGLMVDKVKMEISVIAKLPA